MWTKMLVAAGLLLTLTVGAFAAGQVFDTPKALLDYAYAPYATGDFKDDNGLLYSNALNALFATAEANTPEDDVGPVDFDVFVNGQDFQVTALAIGEAAPEGDGVTVPVTFKNFGETQSLIFHLIREGGGWKINDIESLTAGSTWRLTTLLTPAPDDNAGAADPSGAPDGSNSAPPDGATDPAALPSN
jgi:hypothetical protein